jgi:hypothetical protein
LPEMWAVADISPPAREMILVTVSCATEAIREKRLQ